jgi:putative tricarboxylic transport membrane protein
MPAGGADVSSFLSYSVERQVAKHPEEFGHGAIEGVAGPEAATNAAAAGTLVPLLTLGLPTTATAAIMLAGFQQFGLQPGPLLFTNNPQLVWGLIASLLVANLMLLVLNLPLIGLWVRLLTIPKPWLFAGILVFATLGTIGANQATFRIGSLSVSVQLALLLAFGVLGYVLRRFGYPIAPVVVGLILGPMAEAQLRRALQLSQGDPITLVSSPISAILLFLALVALLLPMYLRWRGKGKVLAEMAGDSD